MEKIFRQSLLYDFYGELLTEHQKSIYEDVVMNDLSYSEIARLNGISRQGVYDMIKRCDKILEEYEDKLKLVYRFQAVKDKASTIKESIGQLKEMDLNNSAVDILDGIDEQLSKILEEL